MTRGERRLEGRERSIGRQRDAHAGERRRRRAGGRLRRPRCPSPATAWRRRAARLGARQVEQAVAAQREHDVAHRPERHAHEQPQAISLRPDECLHHDRRPGYRARPQRGTASATRQRASDEGRARIRRKCAMRARCAECILRPVRKESDEMKRTLPIAVASLALAGRRRMLGQAPPSFQVDPLWPKPLPNHWLLGSVTGVAVDAQDHIWVVHRGYDSMTARNEIGAATTPKTAEDVLRRRRRRCSSSTRRASSSATGADRARLRLAGVARRHQGRCQGQRLDHGRGAAGDSRQRQRHLRRAGARRRPRRPPVALPPPQGARRAPRGAGATAAEAAGGGRGRDGTAAPPQPQDAHVLKFSRDRQLPLQIGKAGEPGGNDSHDRAEPARRRRRRPRPTRSTSPTASATTASSSSTPTTGAYKRTGAPTARSRTRQRSRPLRSGRGAGASSSAP